MTPDGSGIVTGGSRGRVPPLTAKNLPKIRKKREKAGKRGKKSVKRKNQEGSFTLPLLTDRAGYTTARWYLAEDLQLEVSIQIFTTMRGSG